MRKKTDNRTNEEKRSYNMSRINSKNTAIEVLLRKALWHKGIRYITNYKKLPGHPDIAITKYKIAIFCDGEFWHGKDWAVKKNKIKNNKEYWIKKIEANMARDKKNNEELRMLNWVVLRFWGDDIKKKLDVCLEEVLFTVNQAKHNQINANIKS